MLSSLPPHVYCTAEEAYKSMLRERTSQCCVISGESGAGKSETCKLLVQHLARVMGSEESNLNNKINQVLQNKGVLILIKYVIYEIM
jgi:myosin heavy subunit